MGEASGAEIEEHAAGLASASAREEQRIGAVAMNSQRRKAVARPLKESYGRTDACVPC